MASKHQAFLPSQFNPHQIKRNKEASAHVSDIADELDYEFEYQAYPNNKNEPAFEPTVHKPHA